MDLYVRQTLKNWTVNNPAPENGRAMLLLVAAAHQHELVGYESRESQKPELMYRSPFDQAMQGNSLPWVLLAYVTLTPIRRFI
jgi:hypothetical protein